MTLFERLWSSKPWARRVGIILIHLSLWIAAFQLALYIRFEGAPPVPFSENVLRAALVLLAVVRRSPNERA